MEVQILFQYVLELSILVLQVLLQVLSNYPSEAYKVARNSIQKALSRKKNKKICINNSFG